MKSHQHQQQLRQQQVLHQQQELRQNQQQRRTHHQEQVLRASPQIKQLMRDETTPSPTAGDWKYKVIICIKNREI